MKIERLKLNSLTPEQFLQNQFRNEVPVLLTEVGADWAAGTWMPNELIQKLEEENITRNKTWFQARACFASESFTAPELVSQALASPTSLLRAEHLRIWLSHRGHVTPFHADVNGLFVFNVQVQGRKRWQLLAPDAQVSCYAFTQLAEISYNKELPDELKAQVIEFDLGPGEMIFIPPYWFHRVVSLEDFNLNLNWVGTKKNTISNRLALRELEMMKVLLPASRLRYIREACDLLLGSKESDYFKNYAGSGGTELLHKRVQEIHYRAGLRRMLFELFRLPHLLKDFKALNRYNADPLADLRNSNLAPETANA